MSDAHLRFPILLSILAALVTMALKVVAWLLTGSVGLLSDAAESIVNLVASSFAYLALRYAARPADREHTYGHEKVAFFSSGLEGGLIFVAAVGIAWSAIDRLINARPVESLDLGMALCFVAAAINFAVARVLLRVGRKHHSIILEADGHHLMTDVLTSVAVLVALALVFVTGWQWLDPVVALLVACNILWTAGKLVRRSIDGLMDRALPEEDVARIREKVQSMLEDGMTFHALRSRLAGAGKFADFHLLVPGKLTVRRAHDLADRIEAALRGIIPGLEVTIHIEPIEAPSAWQDSELLEIERTTSTP